MGPPVGHWLVVIGRLRSVLRPAGRGWVEAAGDKAERTQLMQDELINRPTEHTRVICCSSLSINAVFISPHHWLHCSMSGYRLVHSEAVDNQPPVYDGKIIIHVTGISLPYVSSSLQIAIAILLQIKHLLRIYLIFD